MAAGTSLPETSPAPRSTLPWAPSGRAGLCSCPQSLVPCVAHGPSIRGDRVSEVTDIRGPGSPRRSVSRCVFDTSSSTADIGGGLPARQALRTPPNPGNGITSTSRGRALSTEGDVISMTKQPGGADGVRRRHGRPGPGAGFTTAGGWQNLPAEPRRRANSSDRVPVTPDVQKQGAGHVWPRAAGTCPGPVVLLSERVSESSGGFVVLTCLPSA